MTAPAHARIVREATHREIRLRRSNAQPITEILSATPEQVLDQDDVIARFAELVFDTRVCSGSIVIALDHSATGVRECEQGIER